MTYQLIDTVNTFRSYEATLPAKGSWLCYADVDFDCITDGYLVMSAKAANNTSFYIREKSATGKVIARIKMTVRPPEPPAGGAGGGEVECFGVEPAGGVSGGACGGWGYGYGMAGGGG